VDHPFQLPSTTAAVRLTGLLAAVIVIVAGCGSPTGHSGPAPPPDPCTVVTAGDVARIARLAAPVTTTTAAGPAGEKICEYHAAISGSGAIIAVVRLSHAQFDAGRRNAGAQCTDLRIGEAAYACGPTRSAVVNVFVRGLVLSVQVAQAGPEQPAEIRALAQFAASRF